MFGGGWGGNIGKNKLKYANICGLISNFISSKRSFQRILSMIVVKVFAMFGDTVDHMYSQTSPLIFTFRKSRLMFTFRTSRLMFTFCKSRLIFNVRKSRLVFTVLKYRFLFGLLVFINRVSIHLSRPWSYYFGLWIYRTGLSLYIFRLVNSNSIHFCQVWFAIANVVKKFWLIQSDEYRKTKLSLKLTPWISLLPSQLPACNKLARSRLHDWIHTITVPTFWAKFVGLSLPREFLTKPA